MLTLTSLETLLVTGSSATAATITAIALHSHYLDPTTPVLAGLTLVGTWALLTVATTADLAHRRPTDLAKDR